MWSRFSRVWLCDPMDCSPSGSSVHGDSPGKNTGVGCYALLQGIFPTQGSNPHPLCLLHWQVGSLPLVPPEKPRRKVIWAQRAARTQRETEAFVQKAGGSCLIISFVTGFPPKILSFLSSPPASPLQFWGNSPPSALITSWALPPHPSPRRAWTFPVSTPAAWASPGSLLETNTPIPNLFFS